MKILRINTQEKCAEEIREWQENGMEIEHFAPAAISAFTSMKLARHIDKGMPQVVMVDCLKNAMAAISARQLTHNDRYKIVFTVFPNSEIPKSIPSDIRKGVDTWIFASQRLCDGYPADLKNKAVVMPVCVVAPAMERMACGDRPIITWIGTIRDAERLKSAIAEVDEQEGRFMLRIAGAGLAKTVMPLVRMARGLRFPHNVEWVGEEYRLEEELQIAACILRTADDITLTETIALQNRIPLIDVSDIKDFVGGNFKPEEIDATKESFLSEFRRCLLYS